MSDLTVRLSPSAIIEAIEGNLVDSSAALGRNEDGVVYLGSDVSWVYTGGPPASRVLRARFTPEDTEDRVAQIHRFFKDWNAPVSWVVGPGSYPPSLGDYLSASGFGTSESLIGMAMNLSTLSPLRESDDLEIREATDDAGLEKWSAIDREDQSTIAASGDSRCRFYLGFINGSPIARAMTCRRNDVVGLYGTTTSTDPVIRDACAMVARHALQDAAAAGAKTAVMAALPQAISFAEGLGFKSYCQFEIYTWPSPQSSATLLLHA